MCIAHQIERCVRCRQASDYEVILPCSDLEHMPQDQANRSRCPNLTIHTVTPGFCRSCMDELLQPDSPAGNEETLDDERRAADMGEDIHEWHSEDGEYLEDDGELSEEADPVDEAEPANEPYDRNDKHHHDSCFPQRRPRRGRRSRAARPGWLRNRHRRLWRVLPKDLA